VALTGTHFLRVRVKRLVSVFISMANIEDFALGSSGIPWASQNSRTFRKGWERLESTLLSVSIIGSHQQKAECKWLSPIGISTGAIAGTNHSGFTNSTVMMVQRARISCYLEQPLAVGSIDPEPTITIARCIPIWPVAWSCRPS